MGRGKLTLDLIEKEKARMITYQKRKRGLKKKAQEFSTLCGVPTGMIIYGPRQNNRPSEVEIWPKDRRDFMEVVNLYRDKAFSSVRGVKSQNLFDFFTDRNRKVYEKIVKLRTANFESKFSSDSDEECINKLSMHQLKEMILTFDNNIEVATRKLALLKGHQNFNNANYNAQVLFQQPQRLASAHHVNMQLAPFNHQSVQMATPFDFMTPVDYNPVMMMVMNGGDHVQIGGSSVAAGPYNHDQYHHALCCDPMGGGVMDNRVMTNNPRAAARFVDSTNLQQLQRQQPSNNEQFPSLANFSSQMHQFNGYYGDMAMMNEFIHKRER